MDQEALIEPSASTELTLSEWNELPENEPGEWVDGRLEAGAPSTNAEQA